MPPKTFKEARVKCDESIKESNRIVEERTESFPSSTLVRTSNPVCFVTGCTKASIYFHPGDEHPVPNPLRLRRLRIRL